MEKAIGALSLKKAVGTDGVSAEHIRFGGGALSLHLSTLFQAMLRHSFVPKEYKESVVVLIVKDRNKDISDPNNYRGIAVTSVVSKIFERLILSKWEVLLQSSEFQFGFKKGIGCAECSHVVQEAIDYYLSNGTNSMLACALDLSKAYDRVSHYGLFCKLIKRGIPVAVVKLIEGWYTDQTLRVKWGGQLSEPVHVSNGVRQGGVLSPLFNVVLDELLCKLKETGRGAKVGGQYVGGLAYADDIVLLSPTVSGLQSMLDVCGGFAEDNFMKFNVQKCSVTVFSRKSVTTDLYLRLCGHTVPVTNQFTHLGTLFKGDRDISSSVKARMAKFYGAANAVVGRMGLLCREEKIWKKVMMRQLLPVLWNRNQEWQQIQGLLLFGVQLGSRDHQKGWTCSVVLPGA